MFQKWILNKIFHETRFSLISFLVRPQAGGESSVQSVGVNITNGTGGEDGGEGGGYWIIQALHKTALHKMSWDMRQGCRDTLEALHTEQTTRKILQINSFAIIQIEVSNQTIGFYILTYLQFLAWKNMTVVQSTNCATHGDACTLIWNWTLGNNATQFMILYPCIIALYHLLDGAQRHFRTKCV